MGNAIGCSCSEGDKAGTKLNLDRGCTDIPWLLLFLGLWGACLAIMGTAISRGGNINKIIHGVDYNGYICGVDSAVADKPYIANAYWYGAPSALICVNDCNATLTDTRIVSGFRYQSTKYLQYCLPDTAVTSFNNTIYSNSDFASASNTASRAMSDLLNCYGVIIAAAFIALAMAFFYLKFVQTFAGVLVWFCIFCILAGGIFICAICFQNYKEAENSVDTNRQQAMLAIGLVCGILTFLLAIEVTKEASRALEDLPTAIFFPIIPFFGVCTYFVYWVYVAVLIFSVSKEAILADPDWTYVSRPYGWPSYSVTGTTSTGYKVFSWDESMQNSFAIHFFHLLWNVEFFRFLTFLTLSGAVSQWYFTPYKGDSKPRGDMEGQLPDAAVSHSFFRAIRYHLGSICLASLILAIINFIRAAIVYMEEQARKSEMNECLRCIIFGCLSCFMKCVECCMRQINKNGMVFVAVYGMPFCPAACSAFTLAWANIARVSFVTMVGNFILNIGVVFVTVFSTGICALILFSDQYKSIISSPAMPVIICAILTYCVGVMFMEVYETCIDTVFMCFLIDEDKNKGTGNYLAGPSLRKLVDGNTAKPEENTK